jgi:hypothetical protein
MDVQSSARTVYFIGCDMGGWHTKNGDALAVCLWDGEKLCCDEYDSRSGALFYPCDDSGHLAVVVDHAVEDGARIVVGIDAALAWPIQFTKLVNQAPSADPGVCFKPGKHIDNPYLFRETERFVKRHVLTGSKEMLLTAPGDKFGNNSSKAQALVEWFKTRLPDLYRPPFDSWDKQRALDSRHTLIEIYPAASLKSRSFCRLRWPAEAQTMRNVGNSDIADAKRAAMTAVCYASSIGLIPQQLTCTGATSGLLPCPPVLTPDEASEAEYDRAAIDREGWIFTPARES